MFRNIGRKIKSLAKVLCWIGIIVFTIVGILTIIIAVQDPYYGYNYIFGYSTTAGVVFGILIIVLGSLLSWVGSFVLYGFGELVENSKHIADSMRRPNVYDD